MSGRPTADLVADLRFYKAQAILPVVAVMREAADRLADYEDKLPACPTCGGTKRVACPGPGEAKTQKERDALGLVSGVDYCYGMHMGHPCPDCVDGKVSIEQLAATWRVVWTDQPYDSGGTAAGLRAHLRSVKP